MQQQSNLQNNGIYGPYSEMKEDQTNNSAMMGGLDDKTESKNASIIRQSINNNPSLGRISVSPYGAVRKFIECSDNGQGSQPNNGNNQSDLSSGVIATSTDANLNKSGEINASQYHQTAPSWQNNENNAPAPNTTTTARISEILGTVSMQNDFKQYSKQTAS